MNQIKRRSNDFNSFRRETHCFPFYRDTSIQRSLIRNYASSYHLRPFPSQTSVIVRKLDRCFCFAWFSKEKKKEKKRKKKEKKIQVSSKYFFFSNDVINERARFLKKLLNPRAEFIKSRALLINLLEYYFPEGERKYLGKGLTSLLFHRVSYLQLHLPLGRTRNRVQGLTVFIINFAYCSE